MPEARYNLQATAVGEHFYLTGGFNDAAILDQFEQFDPRTQTWRVLPPLSTPRYIHAAVNLNNELYLMGGYRIGTNTKALLENQTEARGAIGLVEKYNPQSGKWQRLPDLLEPRFMPAATTHQGKIYVAGGGSQKGILNSVEIFDTQTQSWQKGPSLPEGRVWGKLLSDGQFLYYLGGMTPYKEYTAEVLRFDPQTQTWQKAPFSLPTGRAGFAASITPQGLYLAGGTNPGGFIKTAHLFDFKRNQWKALPAMEPGRAGLDMVAAPQGLYLFGTDAWYTNNALVLKP